MTSSMAVIEFSGDDPLRQARKREEILSAQLHALGNISELVDIARKANTPHEARQAFRDAWRMTDLQAQVVLEMQVQRFTQLEHLKMRDELNLVREYIAARESSLARDRSQ